jgi:hypothetical protein
LTSEDEYKERIMKKNVEGFKISEEVHAKVSGGLLNTVTKLNLQAGDQVTTFGNKPLKNKSDKTYNKHVRG